MPSGMKYEILHVDDEPVQREFSKYLLEMVDSDIRVKSVDSAEAALNIFEDFDCIVSDYMMPSMDGLEFANKIRETSDIPFILYTGKGCEEVAEAAFSAGVDDYLRKDAGPSHYLVLANKIKKAVEKSHAERRLREHERELSWLIENSPDAIFRIDLARGITRCNPAFLNMFGFSIQELSVMGLRFVELVHEEDRDLFLAEIEALRSRKLGNYTSVNRWQSKNGDIVCLVSNVLVIEEDGRFVGVEIMARDVTNRSFDRSNGRNIGSKGE